MMWRHVISIVLISFLAACGFSPLYAKKSAYNSTISQEKLAGIDVEPIRTRIGQEFVNHLSDLLNPGSSSVPKEYRLTVKLEQTEIPIGIQQDRRVTRLRIVITANYILTRIDDHTVVTTGSLHRDGEYDRLDSGYGTYVSQQDTVTRVTRELAEGLKLRLIGVLAQGK